MVLMPTSTVAELVNEARRGSAEARDELVRRHHREAAILAAAMVNDPTEAEDLSQEAFIRAFRTVNVSLGKSLGDRVSAAATIHSENPRTPRTM
jgi:hypothetical protein